VKYNKQAHSGPDYTVYSWITFCNLLLQSYQKGGGRDKDNQSSGDEHKTLSILWAEIKVLLFNKINISLIESVSLCNSGLWHAWIKHSSNTQSEFHINCYILSGYRRASLLQTVTTITFNKSRQHALILLSLLFLHQFSGNSLQHHCFLSFRVRWLLALVAGAYLTSQLGVNLSQSSNKGYSSCLYSSWTVLSKPLSQDCTVLPLTSHQESGPPHIIIVPGCLPLSVTDLAQSQELL
jgi:hypothetical protein